MSLEKFIRDSKEEFDDKVMPDNLQSDFEVRLKSELHSSTNKKWSKYKYWSVAASIILILTMGYLYNSSIKQKNEVRDELVFDLSNQEANSMQLETIYELEEQYKKEDEKILNEYFKILQNNTNSNVKIAVIDGLLKYPNNQDMRMQLINALSKEKEPLVQLKLIKSLTILKEQRAKIPLQQIIDDKESFPVVKGNASASLAMLNLKN